MRNLFLLLIVCACCRQGLAQTHKINALKYQVLHAATAAQRLDALLLLCDQGYTLHGDSLMAYAKQAASLAEEQKNERKKLWAIYYQAYALTNKGLIDSSGQLVETCLNALKKIAPDPELKANLLNQKGRCFMRKNHYKDAIQMGYEMIAVSEKAGLVLPDIKAKTLIGWAYTEMEQTKEALSWHLKALQSTTDSVLLGTYGILYANTALNYNALGKTDSAFYYIDKAVYSARKYENLFTLSNALAIQAQFRLKHDNVAAAETPLKEAVEIRKLIGDPFYIVSDMAQLGLYYARTGQAQRGIAICREGIAMARQHQLTTKLLFLYTSLAENYKAAGDSTQYATVLENILALKDTIYRLNSAEALADLKNKYEAQKKENIIAQQQLSLIRKNYMVYGSLLLVLLIIAAGYFIFRENQKRQQLKMWQALEQEKRISEQAIQEAEENERKRIAANLHNSLGAYTASITSNLDQIALQPVNQDVQYLMTELRHNSQAIVGQLVDTIWALKSDALSLTATGDRIKTFIKRMIPSYPGIAIHTEEHVTRDPALPASQAFHLYQIIQEGISNALEHSGGNEIRIMIESNATDWYISVRDNGTGTGEKEGNGIRQMKRKAAEAGWTFTVVKKEGTILTVGATIN